MIKAIIIVLFLLTSPAQIETAKPLNIHIDTVTTLKPPAQLTLVQEIDTLIQFYGNKYKVPLPYLYTLTWHESRYDTTLTHYNPAVGSYAGASGIFQVMPSTALLTWKDSGYTYKGKSLPKNYSEMSKKLKTDLDFNVHTGIKLMSILYKEYNDWGKVFRAYASGSPNAAYHYSHLILNGIR